MTLHFTNKGFQTMISQLFRVVFVAAFLTTVFGFNVTPAKAAPWPSDGTLRSTTCIQIKKDEIPLTDLKTIQQMGFGCVRVDVRWDWIEKNGSYDLAWTKQIIGSINSNGLKAYINFSGLHPAHSTRTPLNLPSTDADIQAYANYVAAVAGALSVNNGVPTGNIFEVTPNEPERIAGNSQSLGQDNAQIVASMSHRACLAVRQVAPKSTIVIGAFGQFPQINDIPSYYPQPIAVLGSENTASCADAVSFHFYSSDPHETPGKLMDRIQGLSAFAQKYAGRAIPVIIGETGASRFNVAANEQSDLDIDRVLIGAEYGYTHQMTMPINIYEWKTSVSLLDSADPYEARFNISGQPAGAFFANFLPQIADSKIVDVRDPSVGHHALVFQTVATGSKIMVVWSDANDVVCKASGNGYTATFTMTPQIVSFGSLLTCVK